jgi:hypothetical protein
VPHWKNKKPRVHALGTAAHIESPSAGRKYWVIRDDMRPGKAAAKDADGNPTPAPHHILQMQLQMDAANVEYGHLELWTDTYGTVAFRVHRDRALLKALLPVLEDINKKYLKPKKLPEQRFAKKVTGHAAYIAALSSAMTGCAKTGEQPCWQLLPGLEPKWRGMAMSSMEAFKRWPSDSAAASDPAAQPSAPTAQPSDPTAPNNEPSDDDESSGDEQPGAGQLGAGLLGERVVDYDVHKSVYPAAVELFKRVMSLPDAPHTGGPSGQQVRMRCSGGICCRDHLVLAAPQSERMMGFVFISDSISPFHQTGATSPFYCRTPVLPDLSLDHSCSTAFHN